MKLLTTTAVVVALTLFGRPTASQAAAIPQAGEKAPDFSLKSLDNQSVRLGELAAKQTVVIIVLRGWPGYQCPICDRQVHNFIESAPQFNKSGARVVFIYPGPADALKAHAKEFAEWKGREWPKEFLLLLDPDYAMVNAYGLRWEAPRETAYPSTFVIAPGGTVKTVIVSRSHGQRSEPADVLAGLK